MDEYPAARSPVSAAAPRFLLDRREAIPALIGRHQDFLIITGLAGTARDIAALTNDGAHTYTMAGAMGGACMIAGRAMTTMRVPTVSAERICCAIVCTCRNRSSRSGRGRCTICS